MTEQVHTSRPMRCVVTGASGFLGAALVLGLQQRGYPVLAVMRPESSVARLASASSGIQYARASLANLLSLGEEVSEFAPDIFFHLAWWGGNSRRFVNEADQMLINIPGTLHAVQLARIAGAKTMCFFGSCTEYGVFNIPVRETDPARPTNLYGASKLAAMQMAETLCRAEGIRFCGVRPFWTYGPRDDAARMIPSLIEKLLDRERLPLTPGEQIWDFLYVDDATEAVIRLAENPAASGVFNLASGHPVALRSVIEQVRDLIDPSLPLGLGDMPYPADQIMHLEGDITRIRQATGWQPGISLEEGLRKTVAWHRAQRAPKAD